MSLHAITVFPTAPDQNSAAVLKEMRGVLTELAATVPGLTLTDDAKRGKKDQRTVSFSMKFDDGRGGMGIDDVRQRLCQKLRSGGVQIITHR